MVVGRRLIRSLHTIALFPKLDGVVRKLQGWQSLIMSDTGQSEELQWAVRIRFQSCKTSRAFRCSTLL